MHLVEWSHPTAGTSPITFTLRQTATNVGVENAVFKHSALRRH
jgi:hypothetical protein